MDGYLKNNIGFRHFTATKYADFYRAKAFLLGEVLDSSSHKFSAYARETLLQYFSYATDWLMKCEKEFIRNDVSQVVEVTNMCAQSFIAMTETVCNLIDANPDDFDPKFAAIWRPLNDCRTQALRTMIISRQAEDREEAFSNLVDFLTSFMNNSLYCLHEVDSLLNEDRKPFVYVDRFDIALMTVCEFNAPSKRVGVYIAQGMIGAEQSGDIRPHLDTRYVSDSEQRLAGYKVLISQLESRNFLPI